MNGYVINIRGINGSGKSTAVRQWCAENKMTPHEIQFRGQKYRYMSDGRKTAMGWYKPYTVSEGLDPMKQDKEEFKLFLWFFLKKIRPEIVVYEKQIWSTTYKLTSEIAEIAKKAGYMFASGVMMVDYETALNRMISRNGGNITNLDNFDGRFYSVYNTRKNMIKKGFVVFDACIERIQEKDMGLVVERIIQKCKSGEKTGKV